ncbi:hypothetical protein GLOTRDRAFT_125792 [Gloeophyllum trabeum ATCC 11539]|uniref:Diphthine--ammonia ligase n=1 Tax=Gloeophyllum trabeum (strain ATCC 11539 / FP-39264 / Madison 617) TaxID=670483 RepID=S7S2E4_GLOTA|nr:uncharacterized protein GLOTRDRAFT_125792 [Gloeophyllum trabeum ATCC 11539]EPQ59934.1 hypothetical protein GLOTRDRAFT_125792 [Gloeophyllum trabeum ATCC 11539]
MKYVALLSGGKDSCFNLLHCQKNGHELVAAASLGPERGKEEIDSFFYQTVGQDAIEYVANALDVPLYRRTIEGTALAVGAEYGSRDAKDPPDVPGDETEDLYALLSDVKTRHPDILGVSAGAILSDYQRVRLEHVCRRLSLTALCYLWQRDQGQLLAEMIDAGLHAVIIKVAGIGLTEEHLGKSLAQMQSKLLFLASGEYETLTLDCSMFKKRIILSDTETIIHSDNSFASVAYLRVKHAELVQKDGASENTVPTPPLLEGTFLELKDTISQLQTAEIRSPQDDIQFAYEIRPYLHGSAGSRMLNDWASVTNIHRNLDDHEITLEEEVRECFSKLEARLSLMSLEVRNCTNISIFLSSMDLFARVNAVYSTYFATSPPARACVAVDLPSPIRIMLDCVAYSREAISERSALHVQSLSYWAPANIGPYSQAITAGQRIFISGQIGLIPSSMALPSPRSLCLETALVFQHAKRIMEVLKGHHSEARIGHAQLALYWVSNTESLPMVKQAAYVYYEDSHIPALFVVVKALPRDALVEKQMLCHTGRFPIRDEDGEEDIQYSAPALSDGCIMCDAYAVYWETSSFDMTDGGPSSAIICVRGKNLDQATVDKLKSHTVLDRILRRSLSIRLFYTPHCTFEVAPVINALCGSFVPVTPIPCRSISTRADDEWDYAICIINDWDMIDQPGK